MFPIELAQNLSVAALSQNEYKNFQVQKKNRIKFNEKYRVRVEGGDFQYEKYFYNFFSIIEHSQFFLVKNSIQLTLIFHHPSSPFSLISVWSSFIFFYSLKNVLRDIEISELLFSADENVRIFLPIFLHEYLNLFVISSIFYSELKA